MESLLSTSRSKFSIVGGNALSGEIKLAGAKNAATKMVIASLLTKEECVLENFPNIGDAVLTLELVKKLGSEIDFKSPLLKIKTSQIKNCKVTSLSRRNRIPILALGPLLSRAGEAEVPIVGGDRIGPRPIDIHLEALKLLGANIEVGPDSYKAYAPGGLRGAVINLRYPSVGATENIILGSVLAKGKTVIRNAALEPEIIDLIKMLQKMGGVIELGANREVTIYGVSRLKGTRHKILPDRNEAVSFACLAAATKGNIFIREAVQDHLITFLNIFRRIGGDYKVEENGIRFWREGNILPINIETDTHPGFMTDWQQPLAVLLTQAQGRSLIHETVYEDRFNYTKDLNLMGANIKVVTDCLGELSCRFKEGGHYHSALIEGPTRLSGIDLEVKDLRAGIAHVVAALSAQGQSHIYGIEEIDRGYERIDERLRKLGANIVRVND